MPALSLAAGDFTRPVITAARTQFLTARAVVQANVTRGSFVDI